MPKWVRVWLRRLAVVAVIVAVVWGSIALVRLCKHARTDPALLRQLRVTRRNLHADRNLETARVLVEVLNDGERRTPKCRLRAAIWTATPTQRGSGTVEVPALGPGDECILNMRVPRHERARTAGVTFEFLPAK